MSLGDSYTTWHAEPLRDQKYYKDGERRVSLYSRYPVNRHHQVYDPETALCLEVATPRGPLLVYGTIIGIFGNRRKCFTDHLKRQLEDFVRLSKLGPLCVAGDLNQSFSDNYYFTRAGREALQSGFSDVNLCILTAEGSSGRTLTIS